ncbi:MAG: TROVE domain-containing protein [Verrucomicrobia bacterium]|nr:TROVE domain-containing protein [Verrucomicrobiota bacterium]
MANRSLFQSLRGVLAPATTTHNDAGGVAYDLSPRATLARLAATGCLNQTYYASAEVQLDRVLALAGQVDDAFIARLALYSRRRAFMKDMPALFCAILATRNLDLLTEVFPQVVDNGRMLRTFVQIVRSGVTGRKSLGTAPKRLIRQWLERASEAQLIQAAIGNAPSLADIVKMVHPKPLTDDHEAFFAWLIGKPWDPASLPETLRNFEEWKANRSGPVPAVPFQMLTALDPGHEEWTAIAKRASWQTTRMNLNTFARHGVFDRAEMIPLIARRLADPEQVRRARAFPYQLMAAYMAAGNGVPAEIREALQDAMETATANVPAIAGRVVVCPDVSGSMQMPVTGNRKGGTSKVRCVDVAALLSAALVRANPRTRVIPFETRVVDVKVNPRDSVMTNAAKLAAVGGGGTNCSAPLAMLNREKAAADLVIYVSDNESWADPRANRGTAMMNEWETFRSRNRNVRLVCLDLVPNITTQAPDRSDILNIGGFSDAVFDLLAAFAAGEGGAETFLREIESQPLAADRMTA